MNPLIASAPGKLVVAGEYAVLAGAPAVSMAVDRRAFVRMDTAKPAGLRTIGAVRGTDDRLFDAVLNAIGTRRPDGFVELDTTAFVARRSGTKLGIGSSAALAAALVAALTERGLARPDQLELALDAHRRFQGGRGSGVDVATSVWGGLVCYRRDSLPQRLSWPAGLVCAMLSSGVSANTRDQLARLPKDADFTALAAAAEIVAAGWTGGDAAGILEASRSWADALATFDVDYGLGIFAAGHEALARRAAEAGLVYKPCGAGGGDTGIVLGIDRSAVEHFAAGAGDAGFERLEAALDERGASIEGEPR